MGDLEKLQSEIMGSVTRSVSGLVEEIFRLDSLSVEKERKLVILGANLVSVSDELNRFNNEMLISKREVAKEMSDLAKEKQSLYDMSKKNELDLDRYKKEVHELNKNIDSKKAELEEIDLAISQSTPLKIVKENLERSISEIKKLQTILEKEGLQNTQMLDDKLIELGKSIISQNIVLKDIEEKVDKKKKETFPTVQELDDRRKELNKKESDLNTIEARYKKLYADKGANFKV